jgi:hypothetical protein
MVHKNERVQQEAISIRGRKEMMIGDEGMNLLNLELM